MAVAATAQPSAAWTLQQLREVIGFDHDRRCLIHDRDGTFARRLDESTGNPGVAVLESPPHSQQANAVCERVTGTIRRECRDWLIPLSESHLESMLRAWVGHWTRHRIGERLAVRARAVLGGLHHEYLLASVLARSSNCAGQAIERGKRLALAPANEPGPVEVRLQVQAVNRRRRLTGFQAEPASKPDQTVPPRGTEDQQVAACESGQQWTPVAGQAWLPVDRHRHRDCGLELCRHSRIRI